MILAVIRVMANRYNKIYGNLMSLSSNTQIDPEKELSLNPTQLYDLTHQPF